MNKQHNENYQDDVWVRNNSGSIFTASDISGYREDEYWGTDFVVLL